MTRLEYGPPAVDLVMDMEKEKETRGMPLQSGEVNAVTCHGCLHRPDRECVACGAPASVWTDACDGRHSVAWCATCHALLLSGRPATAAPLIYLFTTETAASA